MDKVLISNEDLRSLRDIAIRNQTLKEWSDIVLYWIDQSVKTIHDKQSEIEQLQNQLDKKR